MIFLDSREGSYSLANIPPFNSLLPSCPECKNIYHLKISCKECRSTGKELSVLGSADVAFIGNGPNGQLYCGVEVKEISEFASSTLDGRTQSQIRRMIDTYRVRFIAVYGNFRPGPNGILEVKNNRGKWESYTNITYSAIYKFLYSPVLLNQFFPIVFNGPECVKDLSNWLYFLITSWQQSYSSHNSFKVPQSNEIISQVERHNNSNNNNPNSGNRGSSSNSSSVANPYHSPFGPDNISGITLPLNPRERQLMLTVSTYPGLRFERSKAIAQSFWDINELCNASIEEIANVETNNPGKRSMKIGMSTAKQLYDNLHWPGKRRKKDSHGS